jgi:hypothetical protein
MINPKHPWIDCLPVEISLRRGVKNSKLSGKGWIPFASLSGSITSLNGYGIWLIIAINRLSKTKEPKQNPVSSP